MSKQQFLSSSFKYKEQDPSFVGQELDDSYKNGPVERRKCTDVFCCLIFLITIGGMCALGYFGFKTGHPNLLASPFDEDGHQCGVEAGYQNHEKIFISFMNNDPTDVGFVCVKNCPQSSNSSLECIPNSQVPTCNSLQMYPAKTVVNLCYPSQKIIQSFHFDEFMNISTLQQYFSDLKQGWPLLGFAAIFAFLVSILFTLFIRFFAGCFVWFTLICFWLLMAGMGTGAYLIDSVQFLQDLVNYKDLPDNLKDRQYQIACAIICWTLSAIQLLVICCFMKQIRISIGIIKASADFTREQFYAFLIPVFITILQVAYLAIWITSILYIFSSSKIEPVNNTPFGFVQFNREMQLYTILYVFGLFWVIMFLEALGDYWTCSTVAIWYFEEGEPRSPISRSICRSLKQVGSLAFGSLIVSIVIILRLAMEYFTKLLKEKSLGVSEQVGPAKYALKCASCCIACFERIIRFLTKNAYIMMAISGKNFCESAKQSFYLMLRSTMQFTISHGTAKIFILFGKLTIVSLCCLAGYITLTMVDKYKTAIYSPVFMTILFAIVAYPIASAFMSLFDMASSTILMCYCVELDLMKGTNPKCPVGLRNFLRNYVTQSSEYSEAPR